MQPGWGIPRTANAHRRVVAAMFFFVCMLCGCGNSNSGYNQKTSAMNSNNNAALSNETVTAGNPLAAEPKAGAPQNNDPGSPPGATDAQPSDGTSSQIKDRAESSSATSRDSAVSGVANVTGPFGPFPAESDSASRSSPDAAAATPPEPPENPRGPFGPFPASR